MKFETFFEDSGRESEEAFGKAVGQTIRRLYIDPSRDQLHLEFENGYHMVMYDNDQNCCEVRYLHTDDDLASFVGSDLVDAEIREAPDIESDDEFHEVQFLLVTTSKGVFTVETHNEHNGYYGGFEVVAREVTSDGHDA